VIWSFQLKHNNKRKIRMKIATIIARSLLGFIFVKRLAADGAAVALTYSASPGKADEVVRSIETAGGKALSAIHLTSSKI